MHQSKTTTTGTKELRPLRFVSSWDDGDALDMQLAKLLHDYRLPGIFYIPTHHSLTVDEIKHLDNLGFEIGAHTVDHPPDLKLLDNKELRYQIYANKKYLETLINKQVTKFCYPRGRYDDRAIEILKELRFKSARTTVVLKTEITEKFREPSTIHVFQRSEYEDRDWYDMAVYMAKETSKNGGIFHIWGHSWEIERDGNWEKLENFFKHLRENYQIIK